MWLQSTTPNSIPIRDEFSEIEGFFFVILWFNQTDASIVSVIEYKSISPPRARDAVVSIWLQEVQVGVSMLNYV